MWGMPGKLCPARTAKLRQIGLRNADEYSDAADGTSTIATLSLESDVAEQSDEAPVMRTQPKSQTEKQIDELRKQLSQAGGDGMLHDVNGSAACAYLSKDKDSDITQITAQGVDGDKQLCVDSICMKTAQDTVVVGWLASQTDMLAEDWVIVK